jgi:hypothetical protein
MYTYMYIRIHPHTYKYTLQIAWNGCHGEGLIFSNQGVQNNHKDHVCIYVYTYMHTHVYMHTPTHITDRMEWVLWSRFNIQQSRSEIIWITVVSSVWDAHSMGEQKCDHYIPSRCTCSMGRYSDIWYAYMYVNACVYACYVCMYANLAM